MLKLNMLNFKSLLRKASIDYLIPSLNITFTNDGWVVAKSISTDNNSISILKIKNDILNIKKKEELVFNFADIAFNLKPYINLIKDEDVNIKIDDDKITIKDDKKRKFNLFFCTKEFTNHFSGDDPSSKFKFFYDNDVNFMDQFNEIKPIALKFNKIYFTCAENKLYLEATDKTNAFCNNVNMEIDELTENFDNEVSMCFDFRNFSSIISTIEERIDNFKIKIVYLEEESAGMIIFENKSENEKYFITSRNENLE